MWLTSGQKQEWNSPCQRVELLESYIVLLRWGLDVPNEHGSEAMLSQFAWNGQKRVNKCNWPKKLLEQASGALKTLKHIYLRGVVKAYAIW